MPRGAVPGRFRRRLALTILLVVAVSTALVAVVTVVGATQSRLRNFRSDAILQSRFTAVVAPAALDATSFERLRLGYEARTDANLLAIAASGEVFASARNLAPSDVPDDVADRLAAAGTGRLVAEEASVDGRRTYVVAVRASSGNEYYSFFPMSQVQASEDELTRVALIVWVLVVVVAGAIAWWLTRRTLRPVADVAATAEAIAAGDLGARLPASVGDELGAIATSFNDMADEVERVVERLEAAAARERQFTADVAHELRTPLTGMTASAAVLATQLDQLPERVRRPVSILVSDVGRLRNLVVELLELARLDSGRERPTAEPLRMRDAVASVARSLGDAAVAGLRLEVPHDLTAVADPTRLRRILTNILANALAHGAPPIIVRPATGPAPADDMIAIDIIDHGPGLSEDERDKVFDRFYKSEQSRASGGSGLGLAISRQHARSMGGDVTAGRAPGAGARFTVTLPGRAPVGRDDDLRCDS